MKFQVNDARCPECGGYLTSFPHTQGRCPVAEKRTAPKEKPIKVGIDVDSKGEFEIWSTNEGTHRPQFAADPETRFACKQHELEFIVSTGARLLGWEAGPNMRLNPSNIPTRAQLAEAIDRGIANHPLAKEPGFRRYWTAVEILRAYATWLPDSHRLGLERDLQHLSARIEETVILRNLVRALRRFTDARLEPSTAVNMLHTARSYADQIKHMTGVDLFDEKDDFY